jgi:hypothetical protein
MNSNTDNSTARRNSFSTFMKNLLLLVSPSSNTNEVDSLDLERKSSTASSENSPFQDLYFSFPAFEEASAEETSCGHQSYMAHSSSIMC